MAIFSLLVYAMFRDYKRNSLYEMAKAANTDYQRVQYFFSDSGWDLQAIKDKRLEIIEKQLTTASTKDGLLAIDDTGCPKPFAKKTQGAKWQYCPPLKREEVCNVAVASVFVSETKHFPINVVPYLPAEEFNGGKNDPGFRPKTEIAKALFDEALQKGIKFSAVVFDSWYASSEFIEYIDKRGKIFFSELKSNRNIFMHHPGKKAHDFVKPDELVTLIKRHYWDKTRPIKRKTRDGNEVSILTYSFKATLKDCKIPLKFVVVIGGWNKEDDAKFHILITNQLNASSKTIIKNYLLRWGIEHCFKELKDTFYFDHYQVRHLDKIERYWNLCLIAWTITYWIKQNDYLHKILHTRPTTLSEFKHAINSLILLSSTRELSMNESLLVEYFKIKSPKLKKNVA